MKSASYAHTVTSHCVSYKHVTGKKMSDCQNCMSVVLCLCDYTCKIVSTILKALTLMNAHTNTHVHTTSHPCTFTHTSHTHVHTRHHVHAGWIQSSLYCKPAGSRQDCGDAPSGWGYSRPAEQGGRLFFCHLCRAMCSTFIIDYVPPNIQRNIIVRKHIQLIATADMHWRIKSFVQWEHVHLVHGLGTCFPRNLY